MKKYLLLSGILLLVFQVSFAQPRPKPKAAKTQPGQPDMNKLMDDAMKDMGPEEKAEMKKMMGGIMPTLMDKNAKAADYTEFTSNKQLLPKKDVIKLNILPKKRLSSTEVAPYAGNLYNKLVTKGDAAEIAVIKSITAKASFECHQAFPQKRWNPHTKMPSKARRLRCRTNRQRRSFQP